MGGDVSDWQQAPDWWLASDGKWYPPQSRPGPPAPPPPPPPPPNPFAVGPTPWATPHHPLAYPAMVSRPASLSSTLSGWLQALMWATAGLALATGVLGFVALGMFERYADTRFGTSAERHAYSDWRDLNDGFDGVNAILTMVWLAMFIVSIVWMHKAHTATKRLWSGQRKWSSGWTIGGWFIPFANLIIPKRVINEIERIATSPRTHGVVDYRWQQHQTSGIGWLWWIGLAIALVMRSIGAAVFDLNGTDGDISSGYSMQALGSLVAAAALPCGAIYIRRLGTRLSPRGIIESP